MSLRGRQTWARVPLQIRLNKTIFERVEKIAEENGVSTSMAIEMVLDKVFETEVHYTKENPYDRYF